MQLIARTNCVVLVDLLLPASVLIFLLPVNPSISSIPAVLWVLVQLMFAPRDRRWAAWPMVFVLLLFSRSWWLNEMPHPVAAQDGVLLAGALMAAACVSADRWITLLRLQLLVLPLLLFQLGPSPLIAWGDHLLRQGSNWTPNYWAGVNQGAYLLGLLLLIALALFWRSKQPRWKWVASLAAVVVAAVMVWQTGSRAALLAAALSAGLVWLRKQATSTEVWRGITLLGLATGAVLLTKQLLAPSSAGIPGIDLSSDTGRLAIARCYSAIPFSGNNRFLYGIGFDRADEFCRDPIQGGVAEHAHNLYLQLFANTGVLGLFGLVVLLALLVQAWRSAAHEMDPFPRAAGQLVLPYTLIQGFVDLSLLHWPVTLILTGVLLGIPLSWHSVTHDEITQN